MKSSVRLGARSFLKKPDIIRFIRWWRGKGVVDFNRAVVCNSDTIGSSRVLRQLIYTIKNLEINENNIICRKDRNNNNND